MRILGTWLVAFGWLLMSDFEPSLAAADSRPNILFCIADDWGYGHAGAYGDTIVKTPSFDRVAREGVLFHHAFCAAPSCTPSRAAILTGQYPHRLEAGGNLWGFLPRKYPNYVDLLEQAGYVVGLTSKGWGPGKFEAGGYSRNPAGPVFKNFAEFHQTAPRDRPFCFWLGSVDPHRPYEPGSGLQAGLNPADITVPPFWPDHGVTRSDILDYYVEVQRFDRVVGEALERLAAAGQLENTLVVVTSDNGWPFPRAKANLYDAGTREPLAVRWPAKIKPGQICDDFVNLSDLAPTFLAAANLTPPPEMTGRGLLGLLTGAEQLGSRKQVFLERERHANVRAGDVGYPCRAIRTRDFLYIRNFRPDRWPAGDPQAHKDPLREFGDVDDGPTKRFILEHQAEPATQRYFELCFSKRPAEELYDVRQDPHQLTNVVGQRDYAAAQRELRAALDQWMRDTGDPRATSDEDRFDEYPYFGGQGQPPRPAKKNP